MKLTEEVNDILTTRSFDAQHKRVNGIHPDLPNPPFSLMLVGPKGSGKSNLILRLIYGNKISKRDKKKFGKFYRHFFNKVYVFSPSWKLDPKMERCHIPDEQIFEDLALYTQIIEEIVRIQTEAIEEDGKEDADHIFMIFTDLA